MSMFDEYPCKNTPIPPSYISFTTATISIPLCLITVVGNILVVLVIFVDPNKDLKSPFNYFIANLAIADLIIGLVIDPLSVALHLSEGISGVYPTSLVYIHIPYFVFNTASVLSLAALTMDRYVAITSPMTYRLKLNPKRARFVAAGIWVFSLSFPFIYLKTGYLTYAFVFANTVVILTFLVMLYTYAKIFRSFRNHALIDFVNTAAQRQDEAVRRALRWEQKVTKTFMIMFAFFLGSYLPSCVCIYITNLCNTCSCTFIHWARDIHFVLVITNSAVNPFLYAWRFENFRRACVKILKNCSGKKCSPRLRRVSHEMESRGVRTCTLDVTNLASDTAC